MNSNSNDNNNRYRYGYCSAVTSPSASHKKLRQGRHCVLRMLKTGASLQYLCEVPIGDEVYNPIPNTFIGVVSSGGDTTLLISTYRHPGF